MKISVFFYKYLLLLILVFLSQDLISILLIQVNLTPLIVFVSGFKEIMIFFAFLLFFLIVPTPKLADFYGSYSEIAVSVVCFSLIILYTVVGLTSFPLVGVIMEGRALIMPIILFFLGSLIGSAIRNNQVLLDNIVRFILGTSLILALSGIIDYLIVPVSFWQKVNVGMLESTKGGVDSMGELPDNFYSVFGRRSLGLALNPLLLSYSLIPGLVLFIYRKAYLKAISTYLAMILTFSRLPILFTFAGLSYAKSNFFVKLLAFAFALSVVVIFWDIISFALTDASAIGHFETFGKGLKYFIENPFGYGIGAAGVFANSYSDMYAESGILNMLNQIGVFGAILYVLLLCFGLFNKRKPLTKELRVMALILFLTSILSPQIFVIKATYLFFVLLGLNKNLYSI